jgi:integrative and conjugative element protein (TIGR02256 family)
MKNWTANNGEFLLEISANAMISLDKECSRNENLETGGILIGYYSVDHSVATITEITTPPSDSSFGYNWFLRGITGLQAILLNRWQHVNTRTYYIGEWHYHPAFHVIPSEEDVKQMEKISRTQSYHCKQPILMIAGKKQYLQRQIRVFVFPRGDCYHEYSETFRETSV